MRRVPGFGQGNALCRVLRLKRAFDEHDDFLSPRGHPWGTDAGWLSNMSDLVMAQIGGNWLLLAVNATGGISSYRMSDTAAPLARADAWAFPSHLPYHGQPSLTVLDLPKGKRILVEGMGGAGVAGLSVNAAARLGGLAQPFPADRIGARLSASGQIFIPKGDFLFSARQDSLTLEVSRIEGNATLSRIGAIEARLINGRIVVFATSHGERGMTQLVIDPPRHRHNRHGKIRKRCGHCARRPSGGDKRDDRSQRRGGRRYLCHHPIRRPGGDRRLRAGRGPA